MIPHICTRTRRLRARAYAQCRIGSTHSTCAAVPCHAGHAETYSTYRPYLAMTIRHGGSTAMISRRLVIQSKVPNLWLFLLALPPAMAAAEIFVSLSGSDASGDGSRTKPFATLNKAQAAARASSHPVTVRVGAGHYYQPSPLVLTAADSGVSWVGEGAGATEVRGGHPVTGWTPHYLDHLSNGSAPNIWRAPNPVPGTPFYQLVEGRAPATVARHPNKGAGWLYNWSATSVAGRSGIRWDDATGLPGHFEIKYASAYVWHPYGYSEMTGLANASFLDKEVALYPTPHTMLVKAHLEGSLQFLDAPGEWALGEDDYVYLWPSVPTVSPNNINISAAYSPRVIDISGVSTQDADVVRDITVANLR